MMIVHQKNSIFSSIAEKAKSDSLIRGTSSFHNLGKSRLCFFLSGAFTQKELLFSDFMEHFRSTFTHPEPQIVP
jgi:hypothetical protein